MGKIILCYWPLRGLGAPAKLLLEYGAVDYEFKTFTSVEEWSEQKFTLGLDFPNLPYIIDGDVKLTESWAVYRYIGRKIGAYPSTEKEERESDMLQGVIDEIRMRFAQNCYSPDCYKEKDKLLEQQMVKIGMIEKYLENRKFLLGDKISFLDFALFENFDHQRLFFAGIFDKLPNIQAYLTRIASLERIAAYMTSDRYKEFPITGPMAMWGGKDYNDKE